MGRVEKSMNEIVQERMERWNGANLAKLKQLQKDADAKLWGPDHSESDHTYWSGWHDGITRAIKVLEGRG